MQQLRNLPIGIQDFEKLRNEDYLYVDKTALIYKLVTTGSYYFLSRPRRFGKSMMISTLKAYFLGKKELFKGLAVEQLEKNWNVHPVLHLDLNTEKYDSKEVLTGKLNLALTQWEMLYGSLDAEQSLSSRFEGVIRRAYEKTGQRVVILVDEYDKPMLQAIGNVELQDEYRATLKGFYGALKSMDGCIKFAMLTGVTKFVQAESLLVAFDCQIATLEDNRDRILRCRIDRVKNIGINLLIGHLLKVVVMLFQQLNKISRCASFEPVATEIKTCQCIQHAERIVHTIRLCRKMVTIIVPLKFSIRLIFCHLLVIGKISHITVKVGMQFFLSYATNIAIYIVK